MFIYGGSKFIFFIIETNWQAHIGIWPLICCTSEKGYMLTRRKSILVASWKPHKLKNYASVCIRIGWLNWKITRKNWYVKGAKYNILRRHSRLVLVGVGKCRIFPGFGSSKFLYKRIPFGYLDSSKLLDYYHSFYDSPFFQRCIK